MFCLYVLNLIPKSLFSSSVSLRLPPSPLEKAFGRTKNRTFGAPSPLPVNFCLSGNYSSTANAVPLPSQRKALDTHFPMGNEIITITYLLSESQWQIISVGVSRGALSSCAAKLQPRRISFEALCPCVRPCARATLNQRVGASKGRDSSLPSWSFFGSFLSVQK